MEFIKIKNIKYTKIMEIGILLLLCIVQGLTEFLPVSSSGHLFLLEQIFGIKDNLLLLNLFFHLASLLAVVFFYRKTIQNKNTHLTRSFKVL